MTASVVVVTELPQEDAGQSTPNSMTTSSGKILLTTRLDFVAMTPAPLEVGQPHGDHHIAAGSGARIVQSGRSTQSIALPHVSSY